MEIIIGIISLLVAFILLAFMWWALIPVAGYFVFGPIGALVGVALVIMILITN